MSAVKQILSALWQARQARRAPRLDLKAALQREFYRRDLAQLVRVEFLERYEKADDAGRRWVTIGAHDHEGGTPVQIDGQGNIVKGPAALKGKPADNPEGPAKPESQEVNDTTTFDESAATSSLNRTGKAEHAGHTAEIVEHPEGKAWGYSAKVTGPDGQSQQLHESGRSTTWREAQAKALGALRGATSKGASPAGDQTAPASGGKSQESPGKPASSTGDQKPANPDAFTLQRPKNAPHQPGEHQGELFETKGPASGPPPGVVETPDGRRFGAMVASIDDLHVDPDRFQYKFAGVDPKTGVTKELKEVSSWNPLFAGSIMIWRDPKDGRDYVINGHHRAELAKRAKGKPLSQLPPGMAHDPAFKDENGNYNGKIRTMYVAAESAKEARAAGALTNIAEGRGKPIDAAKFMRDTGVGPAEFAQMGVSLSGRVAEEGSILAGLSDKMFRAVAQGTLPEGRALAIGQHVTKPEFQDKLLSIIEKRENKKGQKTKLPDSVVSEMAREMALAGSTKVKSTDLFGDFESEESTFVERGELTAGLRAALSADSRIFGELGKRGREERLSEAGNVLNQEENSRRAQESAEAAWTFNQLAHSKGPISDAINAFAGDLKNAPGRKKTILRQLTERIRELISTGRAENGPEAGGANAVGESNSDDAGPGGDDGAVSRGPRSAGPAPETSGTEALKEQFAREFARRGWGVERYVKDDSGHEHKPPGEGGGQFTSSGGAEPPGDAGLRAFKEGIRYTDKEAFHEYMRSLGYADASAEQSRFIEAFFKAWDDDDAAKKPKPKPKRKKKASEDDPNDETAATMRRNDKVAKRLTAAMKERGWKVKSHYVANRGSTYLQFEHTGPEGTYSGKVRIADHSEHSENHVAPEIEVLVPTDEGLDTLDWDAISDAIHNGEQGQFWPDDSVKEMFAREFASRAEKYAAGHVDVVETSGKRPKIEANYRPAFGAPRCATCEFFRAGKCSQVHGQIRAEDVSDLYFPRRASIV